ncbi:hypothetical protein C4K88_11480 [Arthrobacter pityocampae]|uniref:Uncharacterized protein n=1 Tax=Arthrobacter pityocampae TaxID=547334 RepID=A0A2S5IUZ7_9MICC|nr:hypothetical protein [Arthrobacter pityocampae]PPB48374.1 hypothetical protein C4K88_11480 [Arthrobacter pityocampae]
MTEMRVLANATTTEDLQHLLTDLPAELETIGLQLSRLPMMVPRIVDLYFRFPEVAPAEMAELIKAGGGSLVFLERVSFDPLSLVDEDNELPDDAPGVDKVLESALDRKGELSGIILTCPVQGLVWRWRASAGWVDDLQDQLNAAIEVAEDEEVEANSALFHIRRAGVQGLIEKTMNDPSYRGTPPHKRGAAAKRLAPEPTSEEEFFVFTTAMEGLGRRDREAAELRNLEIREQLPELSEALIQTQEWIRSHTVAARKRTAADFLARQFEGWAVHAQVADELRAHAANLGGRP